MTSSPVSCKLENSHTYWQFPIFFSLWISAAFAFQCGLLAGVAFCVWNPHTELRGFAAGLLLSGWHFNINSQYSCVQKRLPSYCWPIKYQLSWTDNAKEAVIHSCLQRELLLSCKGESILMEAVMTTTTKRAIPCNVQGKLLRDTAIISDGAWMWEKK